MIVSHASCKSSVNESMENIFIFLSFKNTPSLLFIFLIPTKRAFSGGNPYSIKARSHCLFVGKTFLFSQQSACASKIIRQGSFPEFLQCSIKALQTEKLIEPSPPRKIVFGFVSNISREF